MGLINNKIIYNSAKYRQMSENCEYKMYSVQCNWQVNKKEGLKIHDGHWTSNCVSV